jgi:O-6-methylguanine DNA methyltransferase
MKNIIYYHSFESGIGRLFLAETSPGLARIYFQGTGEAGFLSRLRKDFKDFELIAGGDQNLAAEEQIMEYLNGTRRKFDLRLDLQASEFQRKVLHEVSAIPYGTVKTYGEIARKLNMPGGSRAVGTANARNPIPIVIPCHRVVAVNGLGGYGGGLVLKAELLKLEGYLTI